jgi:site-specific DNA recombinase
MNKVISSIIAIYLRISVAESSEKENSSIKSQEHRCQQKIKTLELTKYDNKVLTFIDQGYSAKDLQRPAFKEMMKLIRSNRVSHLVVSEASRISRDILDFFNVLRLLKEHNVKLISLKEYVDQNSSLGILQLGLAGLFATFERDQLRERCLVAARSRAERGSWAGSIPLGYKRGERPGELRIVEEEAELVRLIFCLYEELGGVRAVQDELFKRGLYRPKRIVNDDLVPERPFADSSIRGILSSRVYLAELEVKRRHKDHDQASLKPYERYGVFPGNWEPIIDPGQWRRVQERLAYNKSRNSSTANIKNKRFILCGSLICGECAELLISESAKSNSYFYYRHVNKDSKCSVKRWRAEPLERLVLLELIKIYEASGVITHSLKKLTLERRQDAELTPQRVKKLEARIKALRREKGKIIEVFTTLDHEVSIIFTEKIKQVQREIDSKVEELNELRTMLKEIDFSELDVVHVKQTLTENVEELLKIDMYLIRQLLMNTVSRIEVYGHDELSFYLTKSLLLNKSPVKSQSSP